MISNQIQNCSYVQNNLRLNSVSHTIAFGLGISVLEMQVRGYIFFPK